MNIFIICWENKFMEIINLCTTYNQLKLITQHLLRNNKIYLF